jgi:GntR family transcriptional repressor for pyruvate dehydrogenase complex
MSTPPGATPRPAMKQIRLADRLAEELLQRIRSEGLQPGDRLPTEAELSTEFGLSRTAVREAMRFLVARGVVDIRAGSGAVVAAIDAESASESLALFLERRPASDYHAIHEVREVLEMRAARCAASRASAGAVKRLQDSHEAMLPLADGSDVDALSRADVEFHARIAAASGNEILWTLLDALGPTLMHPREINFRDAEGRRAALAEHAAIVAAVRDRDPDAAETAMRRHMERGIATYTTLLAREDD